MNEGQIKEEICEIGRRIYANGFVAANDGNISVRLGDDAFLTSPTGVSKGYMEPAMIVKVNARGEVLEGTFAPSSEIKVHLQVYRERPDVGAVIHAHPPYATAFAVAGVPLEQFILPETVFALGVVPVAEYAIPGSQELADGIIGYIQKHDALLLGNHGSVTVGDTLLNAYFTLERLEFYAKVTMLTALIGKRNLLPDAEIGKLLEKRRAAGIPGKNPLL